MCSELCTGMAVVAGVAAGAVASSGWFRKGPSEANALASRDEQGEMAGSAPDCASVLAAIVAAPFFSARLRRLQWYTLLTAHTQMYSFSVVRKNILPVYQQHGGLESSSCESSPGIVLGQLIFAAALGALEGRQFVAAAALLAEALDLASPQKLGLLDVCLADVTPLVVGAEAGKVLAAALDLADRQGSSSRLGYFWGIAFCGHWCLHHQGTHT